MGLDLSADDVTALEERTEVWIAGLQLAALSMRGKADISSFVSAFTGTERHVFDYLAEEVLDRQPEGTRSFLLRTSILDRLGRPLCDAVTGQDQSQATLEKLERRNLLMVPLDDRRRGYRTITSSPISCASARTPKAPSWSPSFTRGQAGGTRLTTRHTRR